MPRFRLCRRIPPAYPSPATLPTSYADYLAEPLPTLTSQTATLTTTAEIQTVLSNAAASGVYYIAPGTYGTLATTAYHTSRLILRPADPNDPPTITRSGAPLANPSLSVSGGGGNIWFDGLRFEAATGNMFRTNPQVSLVLCANVRFSRCIFRGKISTDDATFPPAGGWTSTGIGITGGAGTIVDHNDFSELGKGVAAQKSGSGGSLVLSTDTAIVANDFTKLSEDAIVMRGVERVLIRYNRSKSFRPGPLMHNDSRQGIVLIADDVSYDIWDDFNFTWNDEDSYFVDSAGQQTSDPAWQQCSFYSDGVTVFPSFERVYIADNINCAPGSWHVRMRGGQGVVIARNRAYRSDRAGYDAIGMNCHASNSDDVAMIDNVAQSFSFTSTGTPASGKPNLSTNVTDINNTIDAAEYSEAYFATLETAWLAARTAAGH